MYHTIRLQTRATMGSAANRLRLCCPRCCLLTCKVYFFPCRFWLLFWWIEPCDCQASGCQHDCAASTHAVGRNTGLIPYKITRRTYLDGDSGSGDASVGGNLVRAPGRVEGLLRVLGIKVNLHCLDAGRGHLQGGGRRARLVSTYWDTTGKQSKASSVVKAATLFVRPECA